MVNWQLIKCAFGFHWYNKWHLSKGAFKSGNEYLYCRDCRDCNFNETRWLTESKAERERG